MKQDQLVPCICTGFVLLALFSVPAFAGVVIITETDNNITAEYTGSPSSAASSPKSSEPVSGRPGRPERPEKPETSARNENPTASNATVGKPVDRRILRQQRQRPSRVPDDGE